MGNDSTDERQPWPDDETAGAEGRQDPTLDGEQGTAVDDEGDTDDTTTDGQPE